MKKFIVQMYSVRKEFEKDAESTLKTLKEIGFDAVQLDGMRGNDIYEVAKLLKKYDLKVVGMHIKHDRFENDLEGIIAEAELFECKTIYDKYIDEVDQNTLGYKKTKETLLKVAKKLAPYGYRVGLHNPEYDFNNKVDGLKVMDYICDDTVEHFIYAELDTYWLKVAGENIMEYASKYEFKTPIVHLKDICDKCDVMDFPANLRECGEGSVDFESFIKWGEQYGVEYYAIEQDNSTIGMFNSLSKSLSNLEAIYNKVVKDVK